MAGGWQELRGYNRDLAFLLLFAPAKTRDLCADLFLLGFELDNAIHIPSEVMLAAIRLQWWRDEMTATAPLSNAPTDMPTVSKVPLVARFQLHMASNLLTHDDLAVMIEGWQDRVGDADLDPFLCWGGCWQLIAKILAGNNAQPDPAQISPIGQRFMRLLREPEHRLHPAQQEDDAQAQNLPASISIALKLTRYWYENPMAEADDSLLIWRMVWWRLSS